MMIDATRSSDLLRRAAPALALAGTVGLLRAATHHYDPAALAEAEALLFQHVATPLTHRFVQAGRHALHTVIVGEGPPLVMLHGHGGGTGVWLANLAELAKHFRVYALDWLGWGRSDRPAFQGRSAEVARNWWLNSLEDWRRALGLHDFFLLGHSLGGWMAAEYTIAFPQHVRHLILMNAAGLIGDVHPPSSLFYCVSPQRLVQLVGPLGPWLVELGCGEDARQCPDRRAMLDYYYHLSTAPLSGQLAFEKVLSPRRWNLPLLDRAERLRVPMTLLWGVEDELLRIDYARYFHEHVPHAHFIPIEKARHSPHGEAPEAFHAALRRVRAHDAADPPLARA